MTFAQPRNPRGAPASTGGRWAASATPDPATTLGAPDTAPWPALDYESRPWRPEPDLPISRRERMRRTAPYDAAITPEIANLDVSMSSGLSAELEEASNALAVFDARADDVLGAEGSEVAPLHAVLLRTESVSSSRIEGITIGARGLALAAIDVGTAPNGELVVANVRAMQRALEVADTLDVDGILRMHEALMAGTLPNEAGRVRTQQVWIGGGGSPHTADFVPPHHERVAAAFDDFERFARRADIPGLAHAALAHAQFETIHPFVDGNGRTGRALVQAMLRGSGVTKRITAPISAGILQDTEGYFQALTDFRAGDAAPILQVFASAGLRAADLGTRLAGDLRDAREELHGRAGARRGSTARRVVDQLIVQPVLTSVFLEQQLDIPRSSAHRALDQLTDAGVLRETSARKRDRVWQSDDILGILDSFAEDLRRPRLR